MAHSKPKVNSSLYYFFCITLGCYTSKTLSRSLCVSNAFKHNQTNKKKKKKSEGSKVSRIKDKEVLVNYNLNHKGNPWTEWGR